ncbi:unnamed protein product [Paramecium octaurelia]|uniref:Uncharacterized protein n=1 Tax=Paramecium octaurelia TaxID=43137 RepID=A0A8S1T753_PAROT|nr:unnamed protein product [Paramecium octaurelia]
MFLLILKIFDLFRQNRGKEKFDCLKLKYRSNAPIEIFNDEVRIKQVIINLIGNSFEFAVEGSITVSVRDQMMELWRFNIKYRLKNSKRGQKDIYQGICLFQPIRLAQKQIWNFIETVLFHSKQIYKTEFGTSLFVTTRVIMRKTIQWTMKPSLRPNIERIIFIDDNQSNTEVLIRLFNKKGINKIDYSNYCQMPQKFQMSGIRIIYVIELFSYRLKCLLLMVSAHPRCLNSMCMTRWL